MDERGLFYGSQSVEYLGFADHRRISAFDGVGGGLFRPAHSKYRGLLCGGTLLWPAGPDGNSLRYDHRRKRPDGPGGCGLLQRVQSNFDGSPVSFGNVYFFGTVRENFGYRHAV